MERLHVLNVVVVANVVDDLASSVADRAVEVDGRVPDGKAQPGAGTDPVHGQDAAVVLERDPARALDRRL